MSKKLVSPSAQHTPESILSSSSTRTTQKNSAKSRNYSINELNKYIQTPVSERYEQQINKLKVIRRIDKGLVNPLSYQQQVMDSINRSQLISFEPISPEATPYNLRTELKE